MKTNIKINVEAIADGIIEMHHEKGSSGPLAFGMLDAQLMEILKKQLTEKAELLFPAPADALGTDYSDLPEILQDCLNSECRDTRRDWVNQTESEISKAIYRRATETGAMIV